MADSGARFSERELGLAEGTLFGESEEARLAERLRVADEGMRAEKSRLEEEMRRERRKKKEADVEWECAAARALVVNTSLEEELARVGEEGRRAREEAEASLQVARERESELERQLAAERERAEGIARELEGARREAEQAEEGRAEERRQREEAESRLEEERRKRKKPLAERSANARPPAASDHVPALISSQHVAVPKIRPSPASQ